jgi:hypothetical protein
MALLDFGGLLIDPAVARTPGARPNVTHGAPLVAASGGGMTGHRRADPSEPELRAWAARLAEQQAELDAQQAAFAQRVARFEQRAEEIVTEKADDLATALRIVRAAFPCGIVVEAWGAGPGVTIH